MARGFLFTIILFIPSLLFGQQADSVWEKQHYTKQEYQVSMRDGAKLFTVVYAPRNITQKHPVLFFRTAYSCAPYGQDAWQPFWKSYWREYLKLGYIMVLQDVRGRFKSGGTFVNIRPFIPNKKTKQDVDEASDSYDTIDWLVKHIPGNNAKVGVSGVSYSGFYAAMAALCGHSALKAVSPQAPVTDWFLGDDLHHNGALFLLDAFSFYVAYGFGDPRPFPTTRNVTGITLPDTDSYRYYLHTGALPNFTRLAGDSVTFWKDLMNHPNWDNWWKARDDRQYLSHINPGTAIMVTGGLFDAEDNFGTWGLYRAMNKNAQLHVKLVIGPWYHGQWSGNKGSHLGDIYWGSNTGDWYVKNREIPFFNYYLLGKGKDTIPPVTVFFTGQNKWHTFNKWPGASGTSMALYLSGNHALKFNPTGLSGKDRYISDPSYPVPYTAKPHKDRTKEYMIEDQRFVADRKDVLVYKTEPLTKDITFAGVPTADLWVSVSTTDADFVVKLIDVYPAGGANPQMNGYQQLVRAEVFRGRYRNSFSKPEPFIPGKPAEIRYTMPDIAHTFKKGHCIMVQVQSSWFPLTDRNPQQFVNIYQAKEKDFISSTIRIWHTAKYPSMLLINQ